MRPGSGQLRAAYRTDAVRKYTLKAFDGVVITRPPHCDSMN